MLCTCMGMQYSCLQVLKFVKSQKLYIFKALLVNHQLPDYWYIHIQIKINFLIFINTCKIFSECSWKKKDSNAILLLCGIYCCYSIYYSGESHQIKQVLTALSIEIDNANDYQALTLTIILPFKKYHFCQLCVTSALSNSVLLMVELYYYPNLSCFLCSIIYPY